MNLSRFSFKHKSYYYYYYYDMKIINLTILYYIYIYTKYLHTYYYFNTILYITLAHKHTKVVRFGQNYLLLEKLLRNVMDIPTIFVTRNPYDINSVVFIRREALISAPWPFSKMIFFYYYFNTYLPAFYTYTSYLCAKFHQSHKNRTKPPPNIF